MRGSGSVGMPPSPNISGLVFDEFIIKAGIPVTIYGQVGGTYRSAGPYGSVTITSWPETKSSPLCETAWEYGPMAAGAWSV